MTLRVRNWAKWQTYRRDLYEYRIVVFTGRDTIRVERWGEDGCEAFKLSAEQIVALVDRESEGVVVEIGGQGLAKRPYQPAKRDRSVVARIPSPRKEIHGDCTEPRWVYTFTSTQRLQAGQRFRLIGPIEDGEE